MQEKSVLILGAGLMQKPAIISAKNLNLHTFVIDANPSAEAVPYADDFCRIDLKDREEILRYAAELKEKVNLKGIFTAGTDFSSSVSYAAEKLGFPSHSFEASLNASIKSRMRSCFKDAGVPSPEFFTISKESVSSEKLKFITQSLGFPCVVKPVDNMGARGCRMIRNENEVIPSVSVALENSRSGTAIIEKFMEGPEFSIDAIVYNGTVTITGFADRHIFYPPYFIETGHTMPTALSDESKKLELISCFAAGINALGLTTGAAKADIKYTKNGAEIGEIAARLSGGYMSGWTYPYSSGCNLTEQALKIAVGEEPDYILKNRFPLPVKNSTFELFILPSEKVSAERAWISIPGKIKSIDGLDGASKISGIKNVFPRSVKAGDEIDFPRNNVQKCGNVISLNSDYDLSVSEAEKSCSKILIRLEPNNTKTDDFLNGKTLPDEEGFPPAAFSAFLKLSEFSVPSEIPENESVLNNLSPEFLELLKSPERDWNYLTAYETAHRFDLLVPVHPSLDGKKFWSALLKGGIQGAIYISDSI